MTGVERLSSALRQSGPAVVPYLTAGYPDMGSFVKWLDGLTGIAPAVEIGIPFSDPMADGASIQESSRLALAGGATLEKVLDALESRDPYPTPLIVMSYLNPLLAFGIERVMPRLAAAGVCALVIPDLPLEESDPVARPAASAGIGLVQMVTPLTDPDRLGVLCSRSQGFVYAVTMTGTTGGAVADSEAVGEYLDRVRSRADAPVLAGFGVRTREQVRALAPHCDGVIVGSAIVEAIASGDSPVDLVEELNG
ncbi:MAG: tryptophan synthase subunit alpha [Acidimicrobiia bacterium]